MSEVLGTLIALLALFGPLTHCLPSHREDTELVHPPGLAWGPLTESTPRKRGRRGHAKAYCHRPAYPAPRQLRSPRAPKVSKHATVCANRPGWGWGPKGPEIQTYLRNPRSHS